MKALMSVLRHEVLLLIVMIVIASLVIMIIHSTVIDYNVSQPSTESEKMESLKRTVNGLPGKKKFNKEDTVTIEEVRKRIYK